VVIFLVGSKVRVVPSSRTTTDALYTVPEAVRLSTPPENPALPPRRVPVPASRNGYAVHTEGTGMQRVYLDVKAPVNSGYPPRPVPGSVADLDIVMEHCDFSTGKVRQPSLIVRRTHISLVCARLSRSASDRCWARPWQAEERKAGRLEVHLCGARCELDHA